MVTTIFLGQLYFFYFLKHTGGAIFYHEAHPYLTILHSQAIEAVKVQWLRVIKPYKKFLGEIAIATQPQNPVSQPQNRQGLVPYKQLTWQDFPINDRVNGLDAQTNGTITYDFKTRWELERNTYTSFVTQITFRSWFDTNQSWRRSRLPQDAPTLLRHEQGHLDIMQIGALALMSLKPEAIVPTTGASQLEAETSLAASVKRLVEGALEKIKYRQAQYDMETRHSKDKRVQAQWESKIARELANAKNTQSIAK
jgi:hypothetical protein